MEGKLSNLGVEVQAILGERFPGTVVTNVQHLATGMLNHVYRATITRPRLDIVIRVRHYDDDEYGQCFAAERFAYPLLSPDQPKVPAFLVAVTQRSMQRMPLAVFEFSKGTLLDTVLLDAPNLVLLKALAESIACVHDVPAPGFGTLMKISHKQSEMESFWHSLFLSEVDALERMYPESAVSLRRQLPRWLDILRDTNLELIRPTLVHGDFHARNVIIDPSGTPILIDWEASRYRSPAYDLVQILALNLDAHSGASDEFLRHYLELRRIDIGLSEAKRTIEVFTKFWRIRMGIFMCLNDVAGCNYFGLQDQYRTYLRKGDFLEFN